MEQEVTCPYCGEQTSVEIEYLEDGFMEQHECQKCHKIINITVDITIDFNPSKCECQLLNHQWQLTPTFPKCKTQWRCKFCGETKPLTNDDREKYGIPTEEEYFTSLYGDNTPF
ncbi:MAG: hypothetical protein J6Z01_00080 [Bacteroidales bacterium]|nr:hypothetical protein [Bacteroidales bacterium]